MRDKKRLRLILAVFLLLICISGCRAAPEASKDGEVLRAKDDYEDAVSDIIEQTPPGSAAPVQGQQHISCLLGEEGNGIRLEADLPGVPGEAGTLTMREDTKLDTESLLAFLEPEAEAEDISSRLAAELEESRKEAGEEYIALAQVGSDSLAAFTDGNREAVLSNGASANYEDKRLYDQCRMIHKAGEEWGVDIAGGQDGGLSFSLSSAKETLLAKLSAFGIDDVHLYGATAHRSENFEFYELYFTPVWENIAIAHNFGNVSVNDIHPDGYAWICADGAAKINLTDFCLEAAGTESAAPVLSWEQTAALLEVYLESGKINSSVALTLSHIEFVYYPAAKDGVLTLIPAWNVYMTLAEYVERDEALLGDDSAWNIYINALTGELISVA